VSWKRAPRLARFSSTYPYLHATRLRQKSILTGGSHVPVVLRVREYSLVHSGGSRRAQSGFTVPSYLLTHTGSRVSRSDGWGRNRGDIYLAFAASWPPPHPPPPPPSSRPGSSAARRACCAASASPPARRPRPRHRSGAPRCLSAPSSSVAALGWDTPPLPPPRHPRSASPSPTPSNCPRCVNSRAGFYWCFVSVVADLSALIISI
jgi:hypothetical protein